MIKIILSTFGLLSALSAYAINSPQQTTDSLAAKRIESFSDYTFESFVDLYNKGVQEKLYLQTDKPYYSTGESIWMKGYLVNAITNIPMETTRFIYVELINQSDSLVKRIKIVADEHGFHNNMELEPSLPQGEYVLRGYTQWMRNNDDKFFFSKKIKIANTIDDAVNCNVQYSRDANNNVVATITLRDQSLSPIVSQRLTYTMNIANKNHTYKAITNDQGIFSITFSPPTTQTASNTIDLASDSQTRPFKRTIFIPLFDDNFEVQFFPEGGHLLPTAIQNIAFKAIGTDGLSREVTGELFDSTATLITRFKSKHLGMGKISMIPQQGDKYYVEVTDTGSGTTKRFDLPQVATTGCGIKVLQLRGRILYQITHTPDIDPTKLGIVIHSKGKIVTVEKVDGKLAKTINTEFLEPGISEISIIDLATGEPLSKRIFFVRKPICNASITADKSNYAHRELVTLDLKVEDSQGQAAKGSFAIAVTDRNSVKLDSISENIYNYLYLSSDLKGYIENPGSYFTGSSVDTDARLDVLMMTQGWTRFDIGDVVKRNLAPKTFEPEVGQKISGEVTGFFGNAAKSPTIMVFNPASQYLEMLPLGETNKFAISGFDYPDSTKMIVQAVGKSGGNKTLTLTINEPTFPQVKSYIRQRQLGRHELTLPESFLSQSKERYYYQGGMRVVDMDAITVTHNKSKARTTMYNLTPTRSISSENIVRFSSMSMLTVLATLPGVRVSGTTVSVRGASEPPLVYIDEVATDIEYLSTVSMSDVETLDLVVGPEASIFGFGATGGVILVGMKQGQQNTVRALPSLAKITHLGYKKPSEFFRPKYDVPEKLNDKTPDLRTTIHWDPKIVTDSTGVAKICFYTADPQSTYDIVVEGVTVSGDVVTGHASINRRDK